MVTFHDVMLYAADIIESAEEHLKFLLKLLSILYIIIIYDYTIANEDVPEAVGIMCINRGNIISCFLDNKKVEKFITPLSQI